MSTRLLIIGISHQRLAEIRTAMVAAGPLVSDSDGDGVPNNLDLCPNSDLSEYVIVSVDSAEPYFSDIPNVITTSDGDEELVTPDGCSLTDIIQNGFDAIVAEQLEDEEQSEAVRVFIFDLVDEGYFTRAQGLDLFLAVGGISY